MRVHMRHGNPLRLNLANLRRSLGCDLLGIHAPGNRTCRKRLQPIAEVSLSSKGGKLLCIQHRLAVDKNNVAAHAQPRIRLGQRYRLGKGRPIRHQRR